MQTDPVQAPDRELIRAQAHGLGFDLVGFARLGEAETWSSFENWLARGFAGEMQWLKRDARLRRDTRLPKRGVMSAIVVGLDYGGRAPAGSISRYARGPDYHLVMKQRLHRLLGWLEETAGRRITGRPYVDTGPILERDLARLAGLGWFGKNSLLINPRKGSYFFIGALFTELELEPDPPFATEHCGTCRRCLDACPTGAIVEEGVVDATRCISYLTIEKRGEIPTDLRQRIGTHLFGCDICQEVCPWNIRFASDATDPDLSDAAFEPSPDPVDLLQLDDAAFETRFGATAIARTRRAGLVRNAAVVLGNGGDAQDAEELRRIRVEESDPVVQEHMDWAIGRLTGRAVASSDITRPCT